MGVLGVINPRHQFEEYVARGDAMTEEDDDDDESEATEGGEEKAVSAAVPFDMLFYVRVKLFIFMQM